MTLYQIKPAFQALLRPVMAWLYRHHITANQITLSAMALSIATGLILIVVPLYFLLPIVLFARMALNALDGMLARECRQQSRLGAILNETGDVISDIALYLPFLFLADSSAPLVLAMLLAMVMTEFCGILAQTINGVRSYAGPFGKSDRALVFGAGGLALTFWPQVAQWSNIVWSIALVLLLWTTVNRCRSALIAVDVMLEKSLLVIFALLLVATLVNRILVWRRPDKDWRELALRIRTWWLIIILFSLALLSPTWLALTFFALLSFMALKEFLTLVPSRHSDRMPLLWMFIAIPINYWLIGIGWYGMFVVFIPVYVFLFLPARMVIAGDTQGFLRTASQLHWSLMTTVFAFSHVAFLLVLPADGKQTGALLVLFLVGLTEFNDIAQYLWGKSFGRIKVTPTVSPNKTLAGLAGGVMTTALAGLALGPLLTPLNAPMSILAGLMIGGTGFCGDVVMSAVKRDVGVKDSGTLLPGHGGLLDRLDSLIFTAPVFFHFIRYFCY